ncbi:DUF3140 domain-containing protein [Roseomonas sp. E05]|uniref:DUF3140 domain-containing protein n=1 Tax=Roseomonas sp. E05 TaxID=3046310 RepID=UPI0024B88136|nr:DUF3140 domain-containing protein [Roseomonas sp. E05]MDJ0389268.1 DUF3140 domain-containing protein [Roseomonas sp. E05]
MNRPPAKPRQWVKSGESRSAGMAPGGEKVAGPKQHEAVGHHMGAHLAVRALRQAGLTEAGWADMLKVVGYVHRHMAQRPMSATPAGGGR